MCQILPLLFQNMTDRCEALLDAIKSGNVIEIQQAVLKGEDRDINVCLVKHALVCQPRNVEMMETLVSSKHHEPDHLYGRGYTALHAAVCLFQNFEMAAIFLQSGADINRALPYESNLSMLRQQLAVDNLDAVWFLLQHGADPNIRDEKNESAFHRAIEHQRHDVVREMIKNGADTNSPGPHGSPLMYAVRFSDVEMARLIVSGDCGQRQSATYKEAPTANFEAAELIVFDGSQANEEDIVRLLLDPSVEGSFDIVGRGVGPKLFKAQKDNLFCAICTHMIEKGAAAMTLTCHDTHLYDAACILKWLSIYNTCPLCRAEFVEQQAQEAGMTIGDRAEASTKVQ
jgi:hypothetical protein